ncbi:amino acid adenylation domain-containing protein [Montanilutibacter psychrotolerans]|uniref:Non-ribosomal peptide synthetase n=1 Tax=Montanilutibacter psychrotolerans TaxID=1327343 RepID=A0A3M8SRD1_9GAMM|nr:non-ribosomal peptide synthetase [Lysobacter psychrotolerans]RNF83323.1 non-ribosomal peptide synthetase [Lysobacter psychrotolerans]
MNNATLKNMTLAEREAVLQAAKAARTKTKPSARPTGIPVRTAARQHWPLSFAQQRLWFIAQMWPTAHSLSFGLSLRGPLDKEALQAALDRIVQRHEALRTRFEVANDQPVQCIAETAGFTLLHHDLADGHETVDHWQRIEANTPIDLEHGPMIRGRLLRLDEQDHVLLLAMHHIVSDGWSMGILASELDELYRAYAVQGLSPTIDPLPALPIQYADYAVWQRDWLTDEVQQRQAAFWREQLAGAPALVSLQTDRPRPPVQDYRGEILPIVFDRELTAGLKALSQRHGTTLYMTLLAAWGALVGRLAGQDQVVIGSPVANRTRQEMEPLIGFFVNTLALHLDLSDQPSVAQLLGQVRERVLQAQSHQDLPFEQVVEALKPERTLAHTPIFQLTFAWQNTPDESLALDGLSLQVLPSNNGEHNAQYDLELDLHETQAGIAGTLGFASALYDRTTMERYRDYLEALLRGMVDNDAQAIDGIQILSLAERQQVLTAWNATQRDYPQDGCVHELFERQVAAAPQAVAIEFEGQSLSYGELNEQANRLAHQLIAQGVRAETRVAVVMARGPGLVTAWLAVLKAGGAYVAMDPAYPQERLAFMLDDSRPRVVLTQASLQDQLPSCRALMTASVLVLDEPTWLQRPTTNPERGSTELQTSHLAYVIYTSGSTGRPNGVMVEHRHLANLIGWHGETFPLAPGERSSSTAGVAFDACTWEVWPALCQGATLALPPSASAGDPSALLSWWEAQDLQTSFLVTALADTALARGHGKRQGLRTLLTGGDRLSRLPTADLPFALVNNYGPTEATVVATSGLTRHDDAVIHIGRPIANTQIYLLDRHGQPVPAGAPGEIHIGGAQVARGYLNRPELTRERFVEDPFATQPDARMYKTGDLGRWRSDGTIEYLGRNDHQVKIRGLRIEPGEIEAQLASQPGVREVAVLAREDAPGEVRLVAYIVSADDTKPEAHVLREALAQVLPDYMVPAAYVVLEALPLTPNGKLDRKALPAPDGAAFAQRVYEAPQGEVETTLAQVWSELLRVEKVGRHDSFFDLGGHSLLTVQLMSRVRQRLGVEMAVSSLFSHPVLHEFAAQAGQAPSSAQPALMPAVRPQHLPLSFAQQRLWFIAQMGTEASTAYHMPGGLRLRGPLDQAALQAALNRIVQRHEALRTHFELVDGQPAQRVDEAASFALIHHDLSNDPLSPEDAIVHWQRIEADAPFDLADGPLIRGRLLRLGEHDHVLLLTMHHIVFDGWSLGVLTGELAELYRAYTVQGLSPLTDPLSPLPIQYADYAVWQRDWLTGAVQEQQLAFWREQLATSPALVNLQTDKPRPPVQDYRGDSLPIELDAQLTASLKALSQRHGTTLFMTLLAAWGALVARLADQDEVVIGTPVANRTRAEVEPLIGFFVNTLAIRLDVSKRPSVAEFLAQVREAVLQAQNHQDLPFEQVVEALKPKRTRAHSPIFQLMFTLQNASQTAFELDGLSLEELPVPPANAKFDLTLEWQEAQDRLAGSLCFATTLFEPDTMQRHLGHLEALLRGMVRDDAQAIDAIAIMGEPERHQALKAWNDTKRAYPQDRCVHELFEQQAASTPDAVALVHEGLQLTYAELNRRANRLAHYLLAQGVKPEDRIALCMERSPELIVGLLGILKAGAAYVPLDPSYPAARLAHLLQDAAPVMLFTQERLKGKLPESALRTIALDADNDEIELAPDGNPDSVALGLKPQQAAYIIYTSGSTGEPKGVIVPHRAINRLAIDNGYAAIGSDDCIAHCSNPAFDASTFEIWTALLNGARVLILAKEDLLEPARFAAALRSHQVSALFLTTALFNQYAVALPGIFGGLKYLLFGGERCDAGIVRQLLRDGGPEHLLHVYGPTETTTFATSHVVAAVADDALTVPIGGPISNTTVYLLDRHGEPVPVGAVGEIYIGGAGVALGYLKRPELTAERFVVDPFQPDPHARMYRTGDLARWRTDGGIEFLGRNDHQVKIRGFRIEPGEIEAQLLLHGQVQEAVVLARDDISDGKRLVAYLTHTGIAPEIEDLRTHLQKTLPAYMVPSAFVTLDALPLTPNGKLDRKALPVPDADALPRRKFDPPQGEVEIALAQLWSELLRVGRVGRNDNFFELGGHSLLITRLIDAARRRGLIMDLRQVFDAPTLAALAAVAMPGEQGANAQTNLIPVRIAGAQAPLFCFHEGFGSVLAYERLARFIDADIPVYSIEARAMHEDPPVYRSLVDMARDYLKQVLSVQPVGPYRLAGWSGGGLVAYEIARGLLELGESVSYLGMIDTYKLKPEDLEGEIAETKHYLIRTLEYLRPDLSPIVLRGLLAFDNLDAMVAECHRNGWLMPEVTSHEMDRRFQVANDIARACVEYTPSLLAMNVDLYSAQEPARADRSNGWSALLGPRLTITQVGGTHMSMMQDDTLIAQIAGPMNQSLRVTHDAPTRPAQTESRSADFTLSQGKV